MNSPHKDTVSQHWKYPGITKQPRSEIYQAFSLNFPTTEIKLISTKQNCPPDPDLEISKALSSSNHGFGMDTCRRSTFCELLRYYLIKGSFGFSRMYDTTLMELQYRNSLHEMSALPRWALHPAPRIAQMIAQRRINIPWTAVASFSILETRNIKM